MESKLTRKPRARSHGLGFWWTFAAALVVFAAMIVAIVQNGRHVRLHYLAWHVNVSLIVVILTTALIAVFLDEVGGRIWRRRRRARLGRHHELAQLRTEQHRPDEAPIAPEPESGAPEISIPIERGT